MFEKSILYTSTCSFHSWMIVPRKCNGISTGYCTQRGTWPVREAVHSAQRLYWAWNRVKMGPSMLIRGNALNCAAIIDAVQCGHRQTAPLLVFLRTTLSDLDTTIEFPVILLKKILFFSFCRSLQGFKQPIGSRTNTVQVLCSLISETCIR
jgi:hypothetical protein